MWEADAPNIQQLQLLHFPHAHHSNPAPAPSYPSFFSSPRSGASFTMDVVAAVSGYISKMVTAGESASGSSSTKMKILLLDSETVGNRASLVSFWQ